MSTSVSTKPSNSTAARAPGKLILSGEHAVVYGAPALAVAVDRYTEVSFAPLHRSNGLLTAFENLSQGHFYPLEKLLEFKSGLDRRFEDFMRGELSVQKILHRPDDLAIYTLTSLMQKLPMPGVSSNLKLPVPGQISSRSDLPLGAGMGSSAAVIAATIVLYEHLMDTSHDLQERFEKVRFCERLQHGKGSSIDAAAVTFGGVNHVQDGQVTQLDLDHLPGLTNGHWYWVLQGIPQSSTGECVAAVRATYGTDAALWRSFSDCLTALQDALETGTDPRTTLQENHRLLARLAVVPEAAQRFVDVIEAAGGAAKISGAGSIRGDYAGVILAYMPDADAMAAIMARYPERAWGPLRIATQGAALCPPSLQAEAAQ